MKTTRSFRPSLRHALLLSIALASPLPLAAHAQVTAAAPTIRPGAARMADGLALERRGDQSGAMTAFRQAADHGNAPAQRRLGDIYAKGNSVVNRDFEESTRWYQKARAGGEIIPEPRPIRFLPDTLLNR